MLPLPSLLMLVVPPVVFLAIAVAWFLRGPKDL